MSVKVMMILYVISRLFRKWCSSGVVSVLSGHKNIEFIGFSGTFQDTAVADKEYFYHFSITPYISCISSQMLEIGKYVGRVSGFTNGLF